VLISAYQDPVNNKLSTHSLLFSGRIPNTLEGWLEWQSSIHPQEIDLGLDRVSRVLSNLGLKNPSFAVILIAGTNGKGSSVSMLESIAIQADITVGCFTSPHIQHYGERIRISGIDSHEEILCQAFKEVSLAQKNISLTYFEYSFLAAMCVFSHHQVTLGVFEVGLGGRLDAVNALDADVALVTTVDFDHQDWLGDTLEDIGYEKSGIFRPEKDAIYADSSPPDSIRQQATKRNASLFLWEEDYCVAVSNDSWEWKFGHRTLSHLAFPALKGEVQIKNAAAVLMVIHRLCQKFPQFSPMQESSKINAGLQSLTLRGRFQQVTTRGLTVILDVAHNPQAAKLLARDLLKQERVKGKTLALFGIMEDKSIENVIIPLLDCIDFWYTITFIEESRAISSHQLAEKIRKTGNASVVSFDTLIAAWNQVLQQYQELGVSRVVVFGSFLSVSGMLSILEKQNHG
jgi:dihydrofolate synthase / folylpolyglutamate synthase